MCRAFASMSWVDDFCENPQWSTSDLVGKLSLTGLTPCFEAVIIRGTVNLCFLALLPVRLYQVTKARKLRVAVLPTWLHYVKALCALVNALVPAFLINGMLASQTWAVFELVTEPVTCFTWLLALITMLAENKRWVPGCTCNACARVSSQRLIAAGGAPQRAGSCSS